VYLPNKNYVNGRGREYRAKAHFEGLGYFVVRSAGSHSPADLVAVKRGEVVLVQCKPPGGMSRDELVKFVALAKRLSVKAIVYSNREDFKVVYVPPC
jgi:Holliday junction resolvase